MNIKEKLKLNITFEEKISLINIKKKIEDLILIYEKIKDINNGFEQFKKEMEIL